MYTHSDPTANRAIGLAERDWKKMSVLAYRIRTDTKAADRITDQHKLFSGIFNRLLTDSLTELEQTIYSHKGK